MMDPFTGAAALGAAASIVQVVLSGIHVLNRIKNFSHGQLGLPDALESSAKRLDVLIATLEHLRGDEGAEKELHDFLIGVDNKIKKFDALLDKYLPKDGDAFSDKAKAAIHSFGKEKEISELEDKLQTDVNFLSAWAGTRTLKILTGKSERSIDHLKDRSFFEVPHRRVANFIGRDAELSKLSETIDQHPVVVLQAMGGQGKTQLALEYCQVSKKKSRFRGIFWCNASSESALRKGLESMAELLKSPDQTIIGSDSGIQLAIRTLNLWNEPWLLVLDNYDEPDKFRNIQDYMPNSALGRILITSRDQDTWRLGEPLEVPPMQDNDAVDLLLNSAGLERSDESIEIGTRIVQRLGCLPLAIDQAGSYIRDRAGYASFVEFLDRYKEEADKIWDKIPKVWEYAKTVFTTWEMAFSQIDRGTEEGAAMAAFINLLGFFHHESISESLFQAFIKSKDAAWTTVPWKILFTESNGVWSHRKFQEASTRLRKLSIVSTFIVDSRGYVHISLHPLVSDWIKYRGRDTFLDHDQATFGMATQILTQAMLPYYFDSQLLGHTFRMSLEERKAFLLHMGVWETNSKGRFRKIFPIWIQSDIEPLRSAEACFALFADYCRSFQTSSDLSTRLYQFCTEHANDSFLEPMLDLTEDLLFEIHVFLGDLTKALQFATRVYERRKQKHGAGHHSTLEAGCWLAVAFRFCCKHNDAERLCRELIEVKASPQAHRKEVQKQKERLKIELISILHDKSTARSRSEAESLTNEILRASRKGRGINWTSNTWDWRSYTTMMPLIRDPTLLKNGCEELLLLVKREVGEHYYYFLEAKCYSAGARYFLGEPVDAEAIIQECLHESRDTVAVMHQETSFFDMSMLGLLQSVFVRQGRYIEAEKVVRELIARVAKDTNRDPAFHAKQEAELYGALAELVFHQGRPEDAEIISDCAFLTDTNSHMRLVMIKLERGGPQKIREASILLHRVIERMTPILERDQLGTFHRLDFSKSLDDPGRRAAYDIATAEEYEVGEEFQLGAWSFPEILTYQAAALFMLGNFEDGHEALVLALKAFYKYCSRDEKWTKECLERSSRVLKFVLDSKDISNMKREALYDLWIQHRIICVHAWDLCGDWREEVFKRAERRVRSIKRIGNEMFGAQWSEQVSLHALGPPVVTLYLGDNEQIFWEALNRVSLKRNSRRVESPSPESLRAHNDYLTVSLTDRLRIGWTAMVHRGRRKSPLRRISSPLHRLIEDKS